MKKKVNDYVIGILFIMPAVVLIFVFVVWPIAYNAYLSLHSWKGIYGTAKEFVGTDNYVKIFQGIKFWKSMLNSIYFIIGGFCVLMPLSFCLALLITSKLKFTRLMKTAYFMPVILGTTAVALMWVNILNQNYGILAQVLRWIGLDSLVINWLAAPGINIWCIILVNEWMYAGYNMLIFAAGIVSIPESILEASKIDGCNSIQRIKYIILPLCKNSFMIFSILCITGCLKVFDIVWAMTAGGPNGSSATPGILLYQQAFQNRLYGRSSAIGVILVIFGISLSVIINRIFKQDNDLQA